MLRRLLTTSVIYALLFSVFALPASAMEVLSDRSINRALDYGMRNQDLGMSLFMGGNWREGANGTLLNIYTPYMDIARAVVHKDLTDDPKPEDIGKARKVLVEDINYIWHHPTVKFMVSMYGPVPNFAGKYYARIDGVGHGRSFTLYPSKMIPQLRADKDPNVTNNPFTAINAYHFRYEDIIQLDEFTLKLYGKDMEPITFKLQAKDFD